MLKVFKPSELKANTGGILDKAIKTPQFVERGGTLLVIKVAELVPEMPLRPDGYFADAYGDAGRNEREHKAFTTTSFQPERGASASPRRT